MLNGVRVGFAMTGSFCTHKTALETLRRLVAAGVDATPILSYNSSSISTRFMEKEELISQLEEITGKKVITTIPEAEPIGPKQMLDVLVVMPCTGNSIAKLALSVSDSPVLLACKSHLRNNRPIILAVSTNDGLSGNAKHIGTLLATKNYYFVPFGQDDPTHKPFSLISDFTMLEDTIEQALEGKQIQPVLL